MGKITLTGKGRRWLARGHPWVYADDVARGRAEPGELVPVEDPAGDAVGWGLYSRGSRIALRMVTRAAEQPSREFWLRAVRRAVAVREASGLLAPDGGCRLLAGDADGLPGFVLDRYASVGVVQCGTQGADRMRDFLIELVDEVLPRRLAVIVDRSDTSVRRLESLEPRVELVRGSLDAAPRVREGKIEYEVDVLGGHKTGAYLDQRDNRLEAARHAAGESVMDAFSYDGLFGMHAAKAGAARVVCVEQNKAALERLARNAARNGLAGRIEVVRADCMSELRARAEKGEEHGLVVVDPPAFARSRREVAGAERGYVELNRRALAITRPAGTLVSASCSYNVRSAEFLDFLGRAAHLAHREAWLTALRGAPPDHPQRLVLPETGYLKCAFLRVDVE